MSCKHIGYEKGCLNCIKRKWRNLYPILKEKDISKVSVKDGLLNQLYDDLINVDSDRKVEIV